MSELFGDADLAVLARRIDEWLGELAATNPAIDAVERGDEGTEPRWYVRLRGEEKEFTTVWLTLGQRTLRYEAYVMPAPVDNVADVYEMALRANTGLVGARFAIGVEDALFLCGELPLTALDADEVDRIVGTVYAYVERLFPRLIRLGYARHFTDD